MPTQWITTLRPNPTAPLRLILVPDVGGTGVTFRGWSQRLPRTDLAVVQLPGRGGRLHEPFVTSVSEAAGGVAAEVASGPACPTVLFGHGLGALIAFEAVRRLRGSLWPVLALFVSGQGGPSLGVSAPRLSELTPDQLIERLHRCDLLPPDAIGDPDAMRILLPVVRADIALKESYCYEPGDPLSCPIVACDALSDPSASRTDVDAWRRETTGRFSVQRFGGDRSYIHREQEALTAVVGSHLSVMAGALARSAPMPR